MRTFSRYLEAIAMANAIGGHAAPNCSEFSRMEWIFHPGMLQDSPDKWWGDFKYRHAIHEGIDICFYRTGKKIKALKPGTQVPAMADGIILNLSIDLLGQSMAVAYPSMPCPGPKGKEENAQEYDPILVYSHLDPDPELKPGKEIFKGQIIGQTFDTRTIKSKLLSHLHLSCVLIPKQTPKTAMDWALFSNREKVGYINPVFL